MSPPTAAPALATLVARVALASLGLALLVTGLGTAALLHHHAQRDVDRLLMVAAQGGHTVDAWRNGHHPGPVTVETWDPRQGPPPALAGIETAELRAALDSEAPLLRTVGDSRVMLLAVEPPDVHAVSPAPPDHPHALRIARSPTAALATSVGRFVGLYSLVAVAVLGLAALLLPRGLAATLRPLDETRRALAQIQGLAVRSRLPTGGPREVAQLIDSVNALLARLEAAVSAQTRFTASAAHELRTPVALIQTELELALRRPRSDAEYRAALGAALESVRRLAGLVEGLMALARVHAGQVEEGLAPEHLSSLIAAAVATEGRAIAAAGGTLTVEPGPDPELLVHGPLLTAAIANLLRNAAVHAPGAAVRLAVTAAAPREGRPGLAVVVEDDGPGPQDDHSGGLGLGLSVVREVLARHGGTARVDGRPGGGMAAELWLPLRTERTTTA